MNTSSCQKCFSLSNGIIYDFNLPSLYFWCLILDFHILLEFSFIFSIFFHLKCHSRTFSKAFNTAEYY